MRPVQVAAAWLLQLYVGQQFMIVVWPPCDFYNDDLHCETWLQFLLVTAPPDPL